MSIRTIIEINHDYAHTLDQLDMKKIAWMLVSSEVTGMLNRANGEPLGLLPGIRVLAPRHHSTDLTLTIK